MFVFVSFFITAGTCSNICNVRVYHLDDEHTYYYIHDVAVKIGPAYTASRSNCPASQMHVKSATMYINCSSWNKG